MADKIYETVNGVAIYEVTSTADLPSGVKAGTLAYYTNGNIERYTGTQWVQMASAGSSSVVITNPSGALLGSGNFEVVEDQELSAAATGFTFSSLDGSAAYIYKLTGVIIGDTSGGSGPLPSIILNGDTGANYEELISTLSTTYTGTASSAQADFACQSAILASGELAMFEIEIFSDTSQLHVIKSEIYTNTGTGGTTYLATGQWDATTPTEVTSILLSAAIAGLGRFGAGSRCQLSRLALA